MTALATGLLGTLQQTTNKTVVRHVHAKAFVSENSNSASSTKAVEQNEYGIHSVNEVENSGSLFWENLSKILPEWMNRDIASRLPSSPDLNMGTYHILFTQHNIIVYIMVIAFVFIIIDIALIYVLTYIKNSREYLIEEVLPKFFKKFLPSKEQLGLIILVNKGAFMLFVIVFSISLHFLYINPIPADLGMICDKAVTLL